MTQPASTVVDYKAFERLSRDLAKSATLLSPTECRYLVDLYYQVQEYRIASDGIIRSGGGEPNELMKFFATNQHMMESDIKRAMKHYAKSSRVGRWSMSITGIAEVLAAGLLAHIDIKQAPTVGHIWSFAGLNPAQEWKPKTKRPWNARLKVLCWKIGESFVKQKGRESDVYGKVYEERRALEDQRNLAGDYADQAAAKLEKFNIGKTTEAYKHYSQGKLPPGHLHARAKRYAVKLFLSHWHHVAHVCEFGTEPPKPYIIEHGGHGHYISPPNWPID